MHLLYYFCVSSLFYWRINVELSCVVWRNCAVVPVLLRHSDNGGLLGNGGYPDVCDCVTADSCDAVAWSGQLPRDLSQLFRRKSNTYIRSTAGDIITRDVPDIRFLLAGYPAIFHYPVPAKLLTDAGYFFRFSLLTLTRFLQVTLCMKKM